MVFHKMIRCLVVFLEYAAFSFAIIQVSKAQQHSLLTDKAALLAFKRSTTKAADGTQENALSNWHDEDVCNFRGVTCDSRHHRRVFKLRLNNSNIQGMLSPFLANLTALRLLNLSHNNLFGPIPTEFANLRFLRSLSLDGNLLHGQIPQSLSLLSRLQLVHLGDNKLTGAIPTSIFKNCTCLRYVDLSNNFLTGEIPFEVGNPPQLQLLHLSLNDLSGKIPTSLSNSSNLYSFDVENNHLSGELPSQVVANLNSLQYLNLSYNHMISHDNNTNLDPFIASLQNCTQLVQLKLAGMGLGRQLPQTIGLLANLARLHVLDLSDNSLSGPIPIEFAYYLRSLRFLRLDRNLLHGQIPESLSLVSRLRYVHLGDNKLTGIIPGSIFRNCTELRYVDLSNNFLTGEIPSEVGDPPELWGLHLYANDLSGKIPTSLSNSSNLFSFDVENNHLSGELPSQVVAKLYWLEYLHLSYNDMVSHDNNTNLEPFIVSLSNCSQLVELELAGMGLGGKLPPTIGLLAATTLHTLHLEDNQISGVIPSDMGSLVSNLTLVNLSSNLLKGTIPIEIGQLEKLEQLILSNNALSGGIPAILGQIPSMGLLDLSRNRLSGEIPPSLGDLSRLYYLFLNNNLLSGAIPPSLGRCRDLHKLDLSHNNLTGSIPHEILGLAEIRIFLNLSHNLLNGPLPYEISKLEAVQAIDLSSNNLSGIIFPQISSCIAISLLNLSRNYFQGELPESLGELRNLESFDVSHNQLSGVIPVSLSKCPSLATLDISFNDFNGPIPSAAIFTSMTNFTFLGNPHICSNSVSAGISMIPLCPRRKRLLLHSHKFLIKVCAVASASLFLSTIFFVVGCRYLKGILLLSTKRDTRSSEPALKLSFPRITYKELSEATMGFDQGKLIGSGSYGQVYKGVIRDGTCVAIKVLKLQTNNSTKSFNRECQVLKRIRHRNLIRIVTACCLPDFKALVLPYMSNGSLDSHLYPAEAEAEAEAGLSLTQRVKICSDIAEGMAYLHHHSPVKVIHCDLKPSNILLNDDMTALVSDFGIARLVMTVESAAAVVENMGNSTANILCGSIGYIAPEYGFGSSRSTKGDVYSFGILVLEMVTGKRPTDGMFIGGLSLHNWVKNHYRGRVEKVIDSWLMRDAREQAPEVMKMWEVAIAELLELGLLCTQEAPSTRPSMLDAADDLDRLKRYLNGDTTATFASSLGISSSSTISQD